MSLTRFGVSIGGVRILGVATAQPSTLNSWDPAPNAYIPGTCVSSILLVEPSKTWSFPIKTRAILVPGKYKQGYLILRLTDMVFP